MKTLAQLALVFVLVAASYALSNLSMGIRSKPLGGSAMVRVHVFDRNGKLVGPIDSPKLVLSEAEWRKRLTPEQFDVLRSSDTERPFCGTLLDNTATVWMQEMSDGNSHNLNNLPILQAGSCGDYFKVGQAVNVEGAKTNLTVGHSDDDCKNGQSPFQTLDSLGTPPDQATMPINKYFCNLMNDIGVKAGADGFPAKGSTQEVTHYGKYDDSALYNTSQPAQIKNPGEYKELRA